MRGVSNNGKGDKNRLTLAQAIVKYLQVQYSERDGKTRRIIPGIFGIFGHGNVTGLGQALEEYAKDLPFYQPHNEQAMVHTAAAYAKVHYRLSTMACTTSIGPGATNLVTGAATATVNRLPVLLLPGDYYGTRRQGPVLQQLEHPISMDESVNDCLRPVCRFFDRISRPEQIIPSLPEAMRVLLDPATGAVTIAMCQDIQSHAYDYPADFFVQRVWRVDRALPIPQRIQEAVEMLKSAKRPMIIAGGGVHYSEASSELEKFAAAYGIPVSETNAGKGAVRGNEVLLLGGHGANGAPTSGKIGSQADLVICIGTRLADYSTGSMSLFQNPDVKFISINVTGHDSYKMGALPIVADAREALKALNRAAKAAGIAPRQEYVKEVRGVIDAWEKQIREEVAAFSTKDKMHYGHLIVAVNEEAKPGDTIVAAAGFPPGDTLKLYDARNGKNAYIEFGFSCMGHEIPAGLGVKLAREDKEVYVLIGDGTFLLNPTELVTALKDDLKINIVLAENHGFQSIHGLQKVRAGRSYGVEFRKRSPENDRLEGDYVQLDLAKIAEGMGARTWKVRTPDELKQAIREGRKEKRSCVFVCETSVTNPLPWSGIWWDFEPAEVTNDKLTKKLRKQYEEDRERLQKVYS